MSFDDDELPEDAADDEPALERIEQLDPAVIERALTLAREGIWKKVIAATLGIDRTTLDRWLRRGDKHPSDPLYGRFATLFRQAEGIAIVESTRASRGASPAAKNEQWYGERRWPTLLGNRQKTQLEVTGKDGGPVQVTGAVIFIPPEKPEPDDGSSGSGSPGSGSDPASG